MLSLQLQFELPSCVGMFYIDAKPAENATVFQSRWLHLHRDPMRPCGLVYESLNVAWAISPDGAVVDFPNHTILAKVSYFLDPHLFFHLGFFYWGVTGWGGTGDL